MIEELHIVQDRVVTCGETWRCSCLLLLSFLLAKGLGSASKNGAPTVTQTTGEVKQKSLDKPLPQGTPGSVIGILGGIIAAIIIIIVIMTIFFVYRRQQKNRASTDNNLIDLPPSHKPPPPEKKTEMKDLTADDIQVVHLDSIKEKEDVQKMPLQTQYYDMAAPESPYSEKSYNGNRYEEPSDEDEYMSSQHDHHDDFLEQLHPIYNKLSYRSLDPSRHPDATHQYPQPGSRAPYIYPKEQYV